MLSGEIPNKDEKMADFSVEVIKASGELIPLEGAVSGLGEPLYISVRLGDVDYWGDKVDKLMLVDVFAESAGIFHPVGHYDWNIKGDQAWSDKNRHGGHLKVYNQAQVQAESLWYGEALKVDDSNFATYAMNNGGFDKMDELRRMGIITSEEQWSTPVYGRMGIGSLMVAASSIALRGNGVETIVVKSRNSRADELWKRFGFTGVSEYPVQDVVEASYTKETLDKFLA